MAHTDVTAASGATDSEPADQSLMGLVVEALAMTRASSMDVESVRKIVVVRPTFFIFYFRPLSLSISSSYR